MLLKCCTQYANKFGNLNRDSWPQDWKRSVVMPIPKKSNAKECTNYHTFALISHASKVLLKPFKLGYCSVWTKNFQMYKLVVKRQRNQRSNCQHLLNHGESKGVPDNICFCFIDCYIMLKPLTVWLTTNCGKFLKRWEYQMTLPAS